MSLESTPSSPRSARQVFFSLSVLSPSRTSKAGEVVYSLAENKTNIFTVALSEYHSQDMGVQNHTELCYVKSLLYTTDEVAEYKQMLLGLGGERAVTRQFSSYCCKATVECPLSRGTQDFKWQQLLKNPESMFTWWWDVAKDLLLWWGRVGVLRVCCYPGASTDEDWDRVEKGR